MIQMPGLRGTKAAAAIEHLPETADTAARIHDDKNTKTLEKAAKNPGVYRILVKPTQSEVLILNLERLINGKNLTANLIICLPIP